MTNDPVAELSAKTVAYTSVFASIATELAQARQARIRAHLVEDRRATAVLRAERSGAAPAERPAVTGKERREPVSNAEANAQTLREWEARQRAMVARGDLLRPGYERPRAIATPEAPAPPTQHPATRAQLLEMHRDAEAFYRLERPDSWVPEYMESRGLGEMLNDDCPWRVGYAPGGPRVWTALTDDLHGRGWSDEQILAAGLGTRSVRGNVVDRFHDRMVISAQDPEGRTVGFVGRRAPDCTNEKSPKYLNSPATEIYDKSQVLLGVAEEHELLRGGATPVVVEGALDAYAVTTATDGRCVGVAPSGTALTAAQVDELDHRSTADVVVGMDADAAGKQATIRAYELLQPITTTPRAATWAPGMDPAEMWAAGRRGELASRLERPGPLVDVVIDIKLSQWLDHWEKYPPSVEGRVNAARDVAPTVAALPVDQIGRQVAHLADALELETSTVTGIVTETISERDRPPASRGLDVSRESEMAQ